jgi:hypothetical protein
MKLDMALTRARQSRLNGRKGGRPRKAPKPGEFIDLDSIYPWNTSLMGAGDPYLFKSLSRLRIASRASDNTRVE